MIPDGRASCIKSVSPILTPADPFWEVTVTLMSNSVHTALNVIIIQVIQSAPELLLGYPMKK